MLRDFAVLLGILPEWAYWHARAEWGMSRGEIYGTAALAAGAVALAAFPDFRPPHVAYAFSLPWARRKTISLHSKRWFYMARVLILVFALGYVGSVLVTSAPTVLGQSRSSERELSDHNARVRALEQWRENVESKGYEARLMLVEADTREIKESIKSLTRLVWGTLVGVCIWLIQQLFFLLMKRSPNGGPQ